MASKKENTSATLSVTDKADICLMVKQAKSPKEQVKICADLYRCSVGTIRCVLREGGILIPEKDDKPTDEKAAQRVALDGKDDPTDEKAPFSDIAYLFGRAATVLSLVNESDPREVKSAAIGLIEALVFAEATKVMGGDV